MNNLPTTKQIIKKFVKPNSTVILAVSGGIDSTYLLYIFLELQKKLHLNIVIAHIDHNYRPNSHKDAQFVENLAKKHKLNFELQKLPKIKTGNLEEKFRNARYKFLETVRKKYKADWIVLGHHLNDNIETVLFNLIRGTSIEGLGGMQPSENSSYLLRPLIYTPKQEITEQTKKLRLKHIEDETNSDTKFSRNRLRLNIIPELKKINPSLEKTFLNNILLFQQTKKSINQFTKNWLADNFTNNKIPLSSFLNLSLSFQKSVLAQIYKKFYKSTNKFNTNHTEQILKIIHKQYCNRKKEFGDNYFIAIKRDQINKIKYICFVPKLEKKR